MESFLELEGRRLGAHIATPRAAPGAVGPRPGLVLCHGLPAGPRGAVSCGSTFPELADHVAHETGSVAVAFNLRGTGGSQGEFTLAGWRDDLRDVVAIFAARPDVGSVWIAGVAEGGTLAVCVAAEEPLVRGVATIASPASLSEWARDPASLVDQARRTALISEDAAPDLTQWGRDAAALDARTAAARLAPRPLLVLHGSDDTVVDVAEARALAAAAGDAGELKVIASAGHELRHDPRAIALLIGWLDRRA